MPVVGVVISIDERESSGDSVSGGMRCGTEFGPKREDTGRRLRATKSGALGGALLGIITLSNFSGSEVDGVGVIVCARCVTSLAADRGALRCALDGKEGEWVTIERSGTFRLALNWRSRGRSFSRVVTETTGVTMEGNSLDELDPERSSAKSDGEREGTGTR